MKKCCAPVTLLVFNYLFIFAIYTSLQIENKIFSIYGLFDLTKKSNQLSNNIINPISLINYYLIKIISYLIKILMVTKYKKYKN